MVSRLVGSTQLSYHPHRAWARGCREGVGFCRKTIGRRDVPSRSGISRHFYPQCPATHRAMQMGVQFFQISNDGESWKILRGFDDNLRKKYTLGRVSLVLGAFVLVDVNAFFVPAGYGGCRDV